MGIFGKAPDQKPDLHHPQPQPPAPPSGPAPMPPPTAVSARATSSCVIGAKTKIKGEVAGDCNASARVEVQATGRLTGNIRAPRIVIAEGAMFRGNSDMSGDRK